MTVRAIPKELLPHFATYRAYLGNGRNGGQWGDEITLKHICVDFKSSYGIKSDVQSAKNSARIIYDCRTSRPRGICFQEKDIVEYNGRKMVVESVSTPNCGKETHHYELKCI